MKKILTASVCCWALLTTPLVATAQQPSTEKSQELSLITATADEGFALAVKLARRGVTTTQPNREVLFEGRAEYSVDADSLIAASQVVAIHFQTIAQANNYWKD